MPRPITPKTLRPPLGMYSHGMVAPAGELVVVAGQVGMDGAELAGPDVGAQTKQALANVRAVLDAAGCAMRDVVRLQTFLTRAEDVPDFMKARGELFPELFPDGVYPPNTLLVISQLVRPEFLVEIEAMAVRAPHRRSQKAPGGQRVRRTTQQRRKRR